MFVFNCKLNLDEHLKYPKNETNKKKFKKYKKRQAAEQEKEAIIDVDSAMMSPPEEYDEYRPVSCSECNSHVGVYDEKEEIYYFFNVLASHT